ncbi:MAG: glycosyltransferase family 39 protein [bacterium]|nr:glycosyltransferase family 39 protein [bacterium]
MPRLSTLLLTFASLLFVCAVLAVAALRASHPFELEWQEGGMLEHALRVAEGEALYAEPSLEFAAFPYPPFYHYVAALSTRLVGADLLALRLVSILSTVACLALLFAYAAREGAAPIAGIVAAGLFAAAFRFGGDWYDVGRVDLLAWALTLAGLYVLRFGAGRGAAVGAAGLFFLAFFTKQTALPVALTLAAVAYTRGKGAALVFLCVFCVVTGGAVLAYHLASDGWSTWYWFELLRGHRLHLPGVVGFWREVALGLGLALFTFALGFGAAGAERDEPWAPNRMTVAAAVALLATGWLGRAHEGGFDNTLIPAALAASLLAGPAAARALRTGGPVAALATGILLAQFAVLAWDPRTALPTAEDVAEGERVTRELAAIEGEVFVPYQPYLARRAGKRTCVHYMAIEDLLKSAESEPGSARYARGQRFFDRLVQAIEQRRYGALVMSQDRPDLSELLGRTYLPPRPLADPLRPGVFAPVTGFPARPKWIYLPR